MQVYHLHFANFTTSHIIRAGRPPAWALCASAWPRCHLGQQALICWSCGLHCLQGKPNVRATHAKHAGIHSRTPNAVRSRCSSHCLQSACAVRTGVWQCYLVRCCCDSLAQTGAPPAPFFDVAWVHGSDLLPASWLWLTARTVRLWIDQVPPDSTRSYVCTLNLQRPLGLYWDRGNVPLIRTKQTYTTPWAVPCASRVWKSERSAEGLPRTSSTTTELSYAEQPTDRRTPTVTFSDLRHCQIRRASRHLHFLVTYHTGSVCLSRFSNDFYIIYAFTVFRFPGLLAIS